MTLAPSVRKLTLNVHVIASVGWLGALAVFLAHAIAGLVSTERDGKFCYYSLAPNIHIRGSSRGLSSLDFGCCRLELGSRKPKQ